MREHKQTTSQDSQINVDLWFSHYWTDRDLHELEDAVGEFGTVSGQRSSNLRGMGLHITLAFAAVAVASGFFGALGGDAYAWLKKKIIEIARRPYSRRSRTESVEQDDDFDITDFFAFIIKDDEAQVEMHVYGSYADGAELEGYLRAAPRAFAAISRALENGLSPCMPRRWHTIRAHWTGRPEPEWDVSIRVHESRPNTTTTTQPRTLVSVEAIVPESEFTRENWNSIDWMSAEEARSRRSGMGQEKH